ncbi:energy-dependent translational throttle protein EttA [Babesia caballi]|uniref:Energy-dependent translational throttle protein EttA n=1 Tax=Babesia caballi TaxID=5871 RepID=A0AAV4LNY0_BABCB|nr:energy-dependent translational throttle protein EttA [Babesia caballi]
MRKGTRRRYTDKRRHYSTARPANFKPKVFYTTPTPVQQRIVEIRLPANAPLNVGVSGAAAVQLRVTLRKQKVVAALAAVPQTVDASDVRQIDHPHRLERGVVGEQKQDAPKQRRPLAQHPADPDAVFHLNRTFQITLHVVRQVDGRVPVPDGDAGCEQRLPEVPQALRRLLHVNRSAHLYLFEHLKQLVDVVIAVLHLRRTEVQVAEAVPDGEGVEDGLLRVEATTSHLAAECGNDAREQLDAHGIANAFVATPEGLTHNALGAHQELVLRVEELPPQFTAAASSDNFQRGRRNLVHQLRNRLVEDNVDVSQRPDVHEDPLSPVQPLERSPGHGAVALQQQLAV